MSIVLKVGNAIHEGWKTIQVTRSMETISGSFSLSITDKWGDGRSQRQLKPSDACQVMIGSEALITGYIDDVTPAYDSDDHTITISGRDKTGDLVDCSVANGTGEWKGLKLEALVKKICDPFGIPVKTNVDTGTPISTFNIEQGMTAFEAIQKACAMRGCLAIADGKGGLLITRAGQEKTTTPLMEGKNLLAASAKYSFTERFSHYICKGQQQGDDHLSTEAITAASSTVTDENVGRYRPLVIVADGQANAKDCETRAKWEATVRRGRSRSFSASVAGWQQQNGHVWAINTLTNLISPWLAIHQELLIAEITFRLDDSGEIAELNLLPADAYAVLENKIIKKAKAKNQDSGNQYLMG